MPLDLIAFDLDGTILNSAKEISKRNTSALRKSYEAGVKLVPCTGRSMHELPQGLNRLIDEFGFSIFSHIITDNGAQVYELLRKELLYTKNISKETALAVLMEGRKRLALSYGSFGIQGATDDRGLAWETEEAKPYIREYNEKWNTPIANLEELITWNDGVVKISMNFLYDEDYENGCSFFSGWPELALSSSMPKNLEIMSEGINKGDALDFVSRQCGISIDRTMAIGDNQNDIEMILCAGFGVAMGNAIPELKKKADWVTAGNDEDGFALAVEKMFDQYANLG